MSEERTNAGLSSSALLGALVEWTEDRRPMPDTGIATMYPEAAFDMALVTKEKGVVEQVTRTFWGTWKALVRHGESFTEINVNELRILSPNIRAELRKLDDETFPEDHPLPRRIAMTDHPITPPPELVNKWCYEDGEEIKSSPRWFLSVCAKAAQWGADQELEACCEWFVRDWTDIETADKLRAARRPKPPSLKEQALADFNWLVGRTLGRAEFDERSNRIQRALESLPDD